MIKGTDDIKDILKFMNAPDDIKSDFNKGYWFSFDFSNNKYIILNVCIKQGHNFHNENGPAYVDFFSTGKLSRIYYCLNDSFHRFGGPAIILYDSNGNITSEQYCLKGKIHNTTGPAMRDFEKKEKNGIIVFL